MEQGNVADNNAAPNESPVAEGPESERTGCPPKSTTLLTLSTTPCKPPCAPDTTDTNTNTNTNTDIDNTDTNTDVDNTTNTNTNTNQGIGVDRKRASDTRCLSIVSMQQLMHPPARETRSRSYNEVELQLSRQAATLDITDAIHANTLATFKQRYSLSNAPGISELFAPLHVTTAGPTPTPVYAPGAGAGPGQGPVYAPGAGPGQGPVYAPGAGPGPVFAAGAGPVFATGLGAGAGAGPETEAPLLGIAMPATKLVQVPIADRAVDLLTQLNTFRQRRFLTDLVLDLTGTEFFCHRCILSFYPSLLSPPVHSSFHSLSLSLLSLRLFSYLVFRIS